MKVTNGVIRDARVCLDRDAFLSVWLTIDHEDGGTQGFGGYVLGALPDCAAGKHDEQANLAGEWLVRCMMVCGVDSFEKCVGKAVRVLRDGGGWEANIIGIMHIIDSKIVFNAKETMERMAKVKVKK